MRLIGMVVLAMVLAAGGARAQQTAALTALDYFQIQQLYSQFCHGLDSAANNGALFADAFTEDGIYVDTTGASYEGRQALAAYARQDPAGVKGPTHVAHFTTNVSIAPTSTGARGQAYLVITSQGAPDGTGRGVIDGGVIQDDLVKTPQGWRIARRTVTRAAGGGGD